MQIPAWVKTLTLQDKLILYFPYTGNNCCAEFAGYLDHWTPGIRIQYVWKGQVKTDELLYDNYKNEPDSFDNWIAYRVS